MISSARAISALVVVSGGVKVSTLPKVVLNDRPFSSARYITASAAALAGALLTRRGDQLDAEQVTEPAHVADRAPFALARLYDMKDRTNR